MFKKLLAMMKSPKKQGENLRETGGQRWVKTYEVILSNMEGSPSYPLTHQLAIGSEIGNIIIADPSVSPRHATILLQEEVISIIDHGSVSGTFVNGAKIPAGKFIILEDTDKIKIGDLEVELEVKANSVDNTGFVPPGHEHLDEEEEVEEVEEEVEEEEVEDEEESDSEKTVTKSKVYTGKPQSKSAAFVAKKKKASKFSITLPSYDATNSLIRVLAVAADLLLSYIILVIFLPFDDFRLFIDSIPSLIAETLDFEWVNFWHIASEEAGPLTDVLKELFSIVNELVPVLRLILVFFVVRLVSTIIFGVSISEFMFGVRGNFNRIWARVGGAIRVIIGMITWPLLIFDLPSLASKRTFKEVITLTNTYVGSRVTLFFGIILYFPLLIVLLLVSPMLVGLELIEPIPFNANVSQRVKPKVDVEDQNVPKATEGSRYFGFTVVYKPSVVSLIPTFRFKGEKSKLNMSAGLEVLYRADDRGLSFELFKTFDMKELMRLALSGNFMLHDQYQTIYNYAYSAPGSNRAFKASDNPRQEEMFGKQVVDFTGMAFSLGIDNLVDFMTQKTPFIKSIVDYRTSLLSLFEYKDYSEIAVVKVGKILCLRASYDGQKPFDLLMPLIRNEGKIYKVTFDSKKDLTVMRNQFYKFTLDEMTWGIPAERENVEAYKALEVVDLFTMDFEKAVITAAKAQALYGYYFEKSAEVLRNGDLVEYEIWKRSVQSMMNILPHLREAAVPVEAPVEEGVPAESVKAKLRSNFTDLFNAIESKNKAFFGIEEVPTV
ncbi:MAG: FHA domain-containing protein [Bacteriovoracaceae bacterium]